jgi:GNAT superfamily N-acetyltransferase
MPNDLLVRLYDLPDDRADQERIAATGTVIRRALAPEMKRVSAWVGKEFYEAWIGECEVAFARQPTSCYIAVKDGKLIGFACYEATCRGFLGPMGVAKDQRGGGLGKALLMVALRAMREYGYGYAVIGGAGPADFYLRTVGAIVIPGSDPGIYRGLLASFD